MTSYTAIPPQIKKPNAVTDTGVSAVNNLVDKLNLAFQELNPAERAIQFLIEFEHDSKMLGQNGRGMLLVAAASFEKACAKIRDFGTTMTNPNNGYTWTERFTNPRNFLNLTI